MVRFSPSALAAAAAAAFALCPPSPRAHGRFGVAAYTAKGLGGIASSAATHNNHPSSASALVPSSALARGGGGRYGDFDYLPRGPPYPNDMDDYMYGPGPYEYGAWGWSFILLA